MKLSALSRISHTPPAETIDSAIIASPNRFTRSCGVFTQLRPVKPILPGANGALNRFCSKKCEICGLCIMPLIMLISLAASFSQAQAPGMALDQSNNNYGFYFNGRTSGWQSYTAGANGNLGAVQLWLYSTGAESGYSGGGAWSATLRIRDGEGWSGTVLSEQTISGDGVRQQQTFILDTPVSQTTGSVYSICIEDATTSLTFRASGDLYAIGRCHHSTSYDYNFSTYRLLGSWSEEPNRDTSFTTGSTIISNEAQLAQFAWLVNSGNGFPAKTITLVTNLNLSAHYWVPIGASSPAEFRGTFEGGGHTIREIIIDQPEADYQGLFGHAINGSIQNLELADIAITGRDYVGAVSGKANAMTACRVLSGSIHGQGYVGGVAGQATGGITNCVNGASVYSDPAALDDSQQIGGIAGDCYGDLAGCSNSGRVEGAITVGGIVGDSAGSLVGCANSGAVTSGWNGGGIAAEMSGGFIQDSTNSGTVGGNYIGGIVGELSDTGMIRQCANSGALQGSGAYSVVGGIAVSVEGDVQNCVNSGAISGNSVAGIAVWPEGIVQDCINSGSVSGVLDHDEDYSHAGGIAADVWDGILRNCANRGTVSGGHTNSLVGGIAGWNEAVYDDGEDYYPGGSILNCANSGAVTGLGLPGGLAGSNGGTISNSYWKQTGTEPFTLDATGQNDGTVTDCQLFASAPGTLAAPVSAGGITTDGLSEALNAWMIEARLAGASLRRWTVGSATAYPTLIDGFWTDAGNYTTNWYDAAETNFVIGTAEELAGLAVLVNTGIDAFGAKQVTLSADIELGDREWSPIGSMAGAFGGEFNGNGKTVSGVYVNAPEGDVAGLFGAVAHNHVLNLALQDVDITGGYAGGLAGLSFNANLINDSVSGHVVGDIAAGGIVGAYGAEATGLGFMGNCWSDAHVSGGVCEGGLSGCDGWMMENTPVAFFSYWKNTGSAPYDLPADGGSGVNSFCYSFEVPPGLLDSAGSPALSESLNNFVMNNYYPDRSGELYGWTLGSASGYPTMIPLIRVNEEYISPQKLAESFLAGMTLAQVDSTVLVYTGAHPGTDAASFGTLMEQAEQMGFTFAELADGDAILNFAPSLMLIGFDPASRIVTFQAENGIDLTAASAMNRLASSTAGVLSVHQMERPGGASTVLTPTIEFHADGTADAAFTLSDPPSVAFFRLTIEPKSN